MNLLIFKPEAHQSGLITVSGRQHQHLQNTLKAEIGTCVRIGELNGLIGSGEIVETSPASTTLKIALDTEAPPPLPLKLVLALPRPKMLRRVLQTIASLGIKEIHLINSYRVEKSFWQTPWLGPEAIEEQLLLGLEQCIDTRLPKVQLHKRFKPFVEDLLPDIAGGTQKLVAHPYTQTPCPVAIQSPTTLIIGPEGGFIPYEIEKLGECHFQAVTLGPRVLRVETAIPVLVSRLYP